MISRKLWQFVSLAALVMLPLVGCSGGSNPAKVTEKGTEVTVGGQVSGTSAAKSLAKTAITANTVEVYNAQDGAVLGNATIASDGKFSGLAFTLPSTKTVLVFKATVAQGTFLSIVPIDLSNPPAAGTITGASPISIVISQESTAIAQLVSQMLGLSGDLGDAGQTLTSVTKTYADAAQLVVDNGGQQLAYGGGALALTGKFSSAALLPAMKASDLSYDDLINTKLGGSVESAFIPGKRPIVNFTVTNKATGKGISGLTSFTLHVAQLKADGSTWLNYNLEKTENATRPRQYLPATDSGSTVIDKGDGSYTVILGTDVTASNALVLSKRDAATANSAALTYDENLIHRIAISVTSAAPAKPINPATGATVTAFSAANVVALVYDFVPKQAVAYVNPNGGNFARDIVTMAACDSCHGQLVNHGHHFGSRPDTKVCVVCHTVQNKRTDKPSAEMTSLIHTLHMGEELPVAVTDIAGVDASEIKFPQDLRNCTTCHKGKDANNWKTKASPNACQSCHNNVNAVAGTNHSAQTVCTGCHADASLSHLTAVSTANNPGLPTGVSKFSYEIGTVTVNANKNPVITFKILKDGAAVTSLNVPTPTASATTGVLSVPSTFQAITGFTGGPSLYVAYAVPQDGIAAPADFNNYLSVSLNNLLIASGSPKAGTITGPDANGFFTATITGDLLGQVKSTGTAPAALNASPAYVPAGAKMVTATMIGGFTQVDKSLAIYVQQVTKAASSTDARRVIVANAKCNSCHEQLGTKPVFHSGARNDATMCAMCHNPNRTSSGWAAESASFIHSLHGLSKRSVPYVWHKELNTDGSVKWTGEAIGYPGILRNCEQCHVAGSYDFTNSAALIENVQYRAVATSGSYATNLSTEKKQADGTSFSPKQYLSIGEWNATLANFAAVSKSPYITNGVNYGPGFAVVLANPIVFDSTGTASSAVAETVLQAASTNLVSSPISAACFACHDTNAARSHMVSNGGSIYEARGTAILKKESCLVCHGPRGADTTLPVTGAIPTIKTVHRWW